MAAPPVGSLKCCAPQPIVEKCSEEAIDKTKLFSMVKMNCSFPQCDQSGFIHPDCFQELEDYLNRFLKSMSFSNTYKNESYKKNMNQRDNMWKEKGMYGLIQKQLSCNCGKGYLKKDLAWPPSNFTRVKKKVVPAMSVTSNPLPKLAGFQVSGGGGKTIRYEPAVKPNFPKLESDTYNDYDESKRSSIPGASFVDKTVVVKRGEIMFWDGWSGHIKNLLNEGERPCQFNADSVEGNVDNIDVGCQVQYESVRRGKQLIAISVRLVKSAVYREGVVTRWTPSLLAGIVNTGEEEIVINRKDFVPGGFVGNIVGKFVRFQLDNNENVATHIGVFERREEDLEKLNTNFSALEMAACPLLSTALSSDLDIEDVIEDMSDAEFDSQLFCLDPYIARLAAHPSGYKLVVALVLYSDGQHLDRLISKIFDRFFPLSETASGAICVLEVMGLITSDLQSAIATCYSNIGTSDRAVSHITGAHSSLVFQTCLPLLGPDNLRALVTTLLSGLIPADLDKLANHRSMEVMVTQAGSIDKQSLFLIAMDMERRNVLLTEEYHYLVSLLLRFGGVKVGGVLLHNVSGRLRSIVNTTYGRKMVSLLITYLSDLQISLVLDEMLMVLEEDRPPLFVNLAAELDKTGGILESLLARLDTESLRRGLELIKDHLDLVIQTELGKLWIKRLSQRVNCK